MSATTLAPLLRMVERSLIVAGGILAIYLGYKLFVLGIDKSQGQASALGITLKDFGPGLFFAALGAVVLVTTMRASIRVNDRSTADRVSVKAEGAPEIETASQVPVFFGLEDSRTPGKWADTAFYLETRQLLKRLEAGEPSSNLLDLKMSLQSKLKSITMTQEEYKRYQLLTGKVPLSEAEQKELMGLEAKLTP